MTPVIRALTVCVGYDDILRLTMPTVLPFVSELLVVSSPADERTAALVAGTDRARLLRTDAFYRDGAKFNKGLAIEEGFSALGRTGWLLVLDADIMLPPDAARRLVKPLRPGCLYTAPRRVLNDAAAWPDYHMRPDRWAGLPLRDDRGHFGYFQLFHATDPVLRPRPWYGVTSTHAGRCDNEFQLKWGKAHKLRPGFEVLHVGPCDENWFGRATDRIDGVPVPDAVENRDLQTRLKQKHGWAGHERRPVDLEERVAGPSVPPRPAKPPVRPRFR